MTQALPMSLLRSLAMELRSLLTECWRITDRAKSVPAVFFVKSDYLQLSNRIHSEILSESLGSGSEPLQRVLVRYRESLKLLNEAADAVQELTLYARKHLPSSETDGLKNLSPRFDEHMVLLEDVFGHLTEVHLLLQEHFSLSVEIYETNFSDPKELSIPNLLEMRLRKRNKRFAVLRKIFDEYFLNPTEAGLEAYIEEAEIIGCKNGGFLNPSQNDPSLAERASVAFAGVVAASLMSGAFEDSAI